MSLESYIAEYTFSLVHLCINQSKIYHYILLFTSQPVNPSIYLALSRGEAFQMWLCADDPYAGCILARNVDLSLFAFITDKMFTLAEIIKEGSLQTDHKEQFLLLMPVPESHFSKLMQR